MKFIGLDLGTKTLGIAISDELYIAHGIENFTFKEGYYKKARDRLKEIILKNKVFNIVIGLPLQLDGQLGKRANSIKRFVEDFKKENQELEVNFYFQDERYSTMEAKERLENIGYNYKKVNDKIDMMSAVIILENFLKENKYGNK